MTDIRAVLVEHLGFVEKSFAPNELAYLALNSKVERPVQDRLAWSLHTSSSEWIAAREWRRVDLALLPADLDGEPIALIQTKAMSLFDAALVAPSYDFREFVADDFEKSRAHAGSGTELYSIVFGSHTEGFLGRKWDPVVKYGGRMRSSVRQLGSADAVRDKGVDALGAGLTAFGKVTEGSFGPGSAFGLEIAIRWWLVGPG